MKHKQNIRIIDDFMPIDVFENLQRFMFSPKLPWYFYDYVTYNNQEEEQDKDQFQFVHVLYADDVPLGVGLEPMWPILKLLDIISIIRIKANLTPIRDKAIESHMHFDDEDYNDANLPYSVGILYMNSNNGYTVLENGEKIESVANRLVILPGSMKHASISSTDDKRMVLNMNFVNKDTMSLYQDDPTE